MVKGWGWECCGTGSLQQLLATPYFSMDKLLAQVHTQREPQGLVWLAVAARVRIRLQ
jgi:hypothetical protein